MINFILKKMLAKQKERSYAEYRKSVRPSLSLFRNIKTKDFVILESSAWTLSSPLPISQGPLIHISNSTMKNQGLEAIKQSLENFGFDGAKSPCELETMGKNENQKFYREHLTLNIHLKDEATIQLCPIQRRRNDRSTGIGEPEDMSEVSLHSTSDEFFAAVERAFEKAR